MSIHDLKTQHSRQQLKVTDRCRRKEFASSMWNNIDNDLNYLIMSWLDSFTIVIVTYINLLGLKNDLFFICLFFTILLLIKLSLILIKLHLFQIPDFFRWPLISMQVIIMNYDTNGMLYIHFWIIFTPKVLNDLN